MSSRNFENRTLYHGDNLPFLRGMNSGTVNLIATDPPFNKNKDFHADPGSLASGARFVDRWAWERDVHQEWVDAIKDDWHGVWQAIENGRVNHSEGMGAFLCWLGIRLIEMRRVLADDGSIYLHIDHTAHAYAKALMDAIFGRRNFRNEIVWYYKTGGTSKRHFSRKHDTLLFYTKSAKYQFNPQQERSYLSHKYGFSNVTIHQDDTGYFTMVGMRDVWDIPALRGNQPETSGFPTQKPLALYERVIRASSNPGDLVLDPFAGCATTPIAAERLGRRWVGMDIWDGAHEQVIQRLADNRQLLADPDPQVIYTTTLPERTDEDDDGPDVPDLALRARRVKERWQRLSHAQMRRILEHAQAVDGLVGCAGCGRVMESPFMELDHINPKSSRGENFITNRVLICRPCNGVKGNTLTLPGLWTENGKSGWMKEGPLARRMEEMAQLWASRVRDDWDSPEVAALLD